MHPDRPAPADAGGWPRRGALDDLRERLARLPPSHPSAPTYGERRGGSGEADGSRQPDDLRQPDDPGNPESGEEPEGWQEPEGSGGPDDPPEPGEPEGDAGAGGRGRPGGHGRTGGRGGEGRALEPGVGGSGLGEPYRPWFFGGESPKPWFSDDRHGRSG
ncbi:MAG TPA: hypothetical protein VMV17_12745 [Streptosporangiaceae bacterium]|nr:hypothetical protein [Streptosporangiaceae bacterium]